MFNKTLLMKTKKAKQVFHTSITVQSVMNGSLFMSYGVDGMYQPEYYFQPTVVVDGAVLDWIVTDYWYYEWNGNPKGSLAQSSMYFETEGGNFISVNVADTIYVTRLDTGVTAQFDYDNDSKIYWNYNTPLFAESDMGKTIELEIVLE